MTCPHGRPENVACPWCAGGKAAEEARARIDAILGHDRLHTSDIRRLPDDDLAAELAHRAARVDGALCSGPGMMWSDRAVLAEAARRLRLPEKRTCDSVRE